MRIIRSIKEMSGFCVKNRSGGKTIGLVPTMGALHKGHLSLIRRARSENSKVVVSIFVNPIQFGAREDLKKYPRNLKKDASLCRYAGVDVIFYPGIRQMYPEGCQTYVNVEGLSGYLCGKFRPGHFRGVATVVAKLFNIVMPDTAYFGQKDAQQAAVIKKMAADLNMPVKIRIMPIVRERDGLAMSSRNAYLSPQERQEAAVLYRALVSAKKLIRSGNLNTADIIRRMKRLISAKKSAKIQYIEIVDADSLKVLRKIKGKALIALAVFIGKTRLIDNVIVSLRALRHKVTMSHV